MTPQWRSRLGKGLARQILLWLLDAVECQRSRHRPTHRGLAWTAVLSTLAHIMELTIQPAQADGLEAKGRVGYGLQ